jgi:hypothetical protein
MNCKHTDSDIYCAQCDLDSVRYYARLGEAAPKMYDALKEILSDKDNKISARGVFLALRAIEAAEGE